jgi:hypothetical protein
VANLAISNVRIALAGHQLFERLPPVAHAGKTETQTLGLFKGNRYPFGVCEQTVVEIHPIGGAPIGLARTKGR